MSPAVCVEKLNLWLLPVTPGHQPVSVLGRCGLGHNVRDFCFVCSEIDDVNTDQLHLDIW